MFYHLQSGTAQAMPEMGKWEALGLKLDFGQTQQRTEMTGGWVLQSFAPRVQC